MAGPAPLYADRGDGRTYPAADRRRSGKTSTPVGLHIVLFEACSAFTHVAACPLALSPICDTLIEGFSHFVTSMTAPIASGGSEFAGWGLHPLESAALPRRTPISDFRVSRSSTGSAQE